MPEHLETYQLMRLGLSFAEAQEIEAGVAEELLTIDALFKKAEAAQKRG